MSQDSFESEIQSLREILRHKEREYQERQRTLEIEIFRLRKYIGKLERAYDAILPYAPEPDLSRIEKHMSPDPCTVGGI